MASLLRITDCFSIVLFYSRGLHAGNVIFRQNILLCFINERINVTAIQFVRKVLGGVFLSGAALYRSGYCL